jgi:hypothetical protein
MKVGRPLLDLTGRRFGKLVVIGQLASDYATSHDSEWEVSCECGAVFSAKGANLKAGRTRTCGQHKSFKGKNNPSYLHGQTLTPEYRAYQSAKTRCTNQLLKCFPQYGGRGIKFCFTSFTQWYNELGSRPSPEYSVDRINNNGNYEPGNLRWATKREQVLNRRHVSVAYNLPTEELQAIIDARTPEYGLCGC